MQFFAAFKSIIPEFHAFSDEDKRYNIGATWTGVDGLKDHHNLELRYVRNSERLALQGDLHHAGNERNSTGRIAEKSVSKKKSPAS